MKKIIHTFKSLPRPQAVAFFVLLTALIIEASLFLTGTAPVGPFGDKNGMDQKDDMATSSVPIVDVFEAGAERSGSLTRSGVLKSQTEIMLAPKIGGRLIERFIERGDTVSAGQLVARLDQDQSLITARQNAAVNLGISQSNADRTVTIIEEDKRQAQLQLQNAQTDLVLKQQALESAQIALTNAQNNERNTENQSEQESATVTQGAIEALRASQTTTDNALVALSDLVGDVFAGASVHEITVRGLYFDSLARATTASDSINGVSNISGETAILAAINSALSAFETLRSAFASANTALNDPNIEVDKKNLGIDVIGAKLTISQNRSSVDAAIREFSSLRDQIRTIQIINQSRADVANGALLSAEIQFLSARQAVTLAQNNIESAQANLRAIDARLDQQLASAQSQVSIALNQLAAADAELAKSSIISPISGVVAQVLADPGTLLSPGSPVAKIIDPNSLKIEVSVSPADAQRIDRAQPVLVMRTGEQADALGATRDAFIREIQPVADAQTRQIIVTIVLDNADNTLIPESFVEVEIPLLEGGSELTIPLKSVVISQDDTQVALIVDNKITWRSVVLGQTRGTVVVVSSGLKAGDRIVAANPEFLDEGEVIKVSEN